MFVETTRRDYFLLLGALVFFVIAVWFIVESIKNWKNDPKDSRRFLFGGIAGLIMGVLFVVTAKITIIESQPINYILKEPLKISIDRGLKPHADTNKDINGLTVINNGDFERMVDHINFKKDDTIKIKTIEEYDALDKNDKRDWRNARVYIILENKLIELPYEDIKKQEIDKLLMSMYDGK